MIQTTPARRTDVKKYKILLFVGIILFFTGVGVIMYPHISGRIYNKQLNNIIETHDSSVDDMYQSTDTDDIREEIEKINKEDPDANYTIEDYVKDNDIKPKPEEKKLDWALVSLLREQVTLYNQELIDQGQYEMNDPFSYEQPSFELASYSVWDNIFGHVTAPTINLNMPIYLGANLTNMNLGAAHLSYSSIPIGGESTNAVLAGHRGIIGKEFFDNIVFLQEGDPVYITNLWETLEYHVVETKVITPYDIEQCYIQKDRDLLTLITCHPYGYTDFRYVVICERTEQGSSVES